MYTSDLMRTEHMYILKCSRINHLNKINTFKKEILKEMHVIITVRITCTCTCTNTTTYNVIYMWYYTAIDVILYCNTCGIILQYTWYYIVHNTRDTTLQYMYMWYYTAIQTIHVQPWVPLKVNHVHKVTHVGPPPPSPWPKSSMLWRLFPLSLNCFTVFTTYIHPRIMHFTQQYTQHYMYMLEYVDAHAYKCTCTS